VVLHDDENTAQVIARWFNDFLRATGLQWLHDTNYNVIDHILCFSFVKRWHEETSSFHLLFGKMTMTLDDVSYLMHLPIEGMLLDYGGLVFRTDVVNMIVQLLGADVVKA